MSGPVASMPLAQAQAQGQVPYPNTQGALNGQPGNAVAPAAVQQPPPVVVDLDLDDIPDQPFSPHTFRLNGIVYTLQLEDDNLLTQLSEFDRSGEMDLDEMHEYFFTETFVSAVDAQGQPVPDGLKTLLDAFIATDDDGRRVVSLRKRKLITEEAAMKWAEELTDPSMRPSPRRNRHDRRAAARRQRR